MDRNNTSFPLHITERLRSIYKEYKEGNTRMSQILKYYQYLLRTIINDPDYSLRGFLIYHKMGMGKTYLAVSIALALRDKYRPIIIAPKSLHENFAGSVDTVMKRLNKQPIKISSVSMDAYNMIEQLSNLIIGKSTQDITPLNKVLLIVDEAHNLFRAIINNSNNAKQFYNTIMASKDIKIIFLTGTPSAKDPFELVPCFNMLAGWELLPAHYDHFYETFIDRESRGIKNVDKFMNRIVGLVSYAGYELPDHLTDSSSQKDFPIELPTIIEKTQMSPDQYRQYLLLREQEDVEIKQLAPKILHRVEAKLSLPGSEKNSGSTYHVKSRMISNFFVGTDYDIKNIFTFDPAKLSPETFTNAASPKISKMIKNIESSPGPVLIYSQFVGNGGLSIVVRYLENNGYQPHLVTGGSDLETHEENVTGESVIKELPIADFEWFYDAKLWGVSCKTLRVIEKYKERYSAIYDRIMSANMDIPVIVKVNRIPTEKSKFLIHKNKEQLARALIEKHTTVKIQEFYVRTFRFNSEFYNADLLENLYTDDRLFHKFNLKKLSMLPRTIITVNTYLISLKNSEYVVYNTKQKQMWKITAEELKTAIYSHHGGVDVRRYALISGEVPHEERIRIQSAWNSPKNIHGSEIFVLLISKTGAEGLDLKYGRQVHILEPYWDKSREEQVIARVVRIGSHTLLPPDERTVQPYLYIAVENKAAWEKIPADSREQNTIDEKFHIRASNKQKLNIHMRKILQGASLECSLYKDFGIDVGHCIMCKPTDIELFHKDINLDLKSSNPCEIMEKRTIQGKEIIYEDNKYYYEESDNIFKYKFYKFDDRFNNWVSIDESSILFMKLLKLVKSA